MRILLDTDIGDDIDDALALALALRLPDVELVGVTTVFRDTQARARMTRYLLDQFERPECRSISARASHWPSRSNHRVGSPVDTHASRCRACVVTHAVDIHPQHLYCS